MNFTQEQISELMLNIANSEKWLKFTDSNDFKCVYEK